MQDRAAETGRVTLPPITLSSITLSSITLPPITLSSGGAGEAGEADIQRPGESPE